MTIFHSTHTHVDIVLENHSYSSKHISIPHWYLTVSFIVSFQLKRVKIFLKKFNIIAWFTSRNCVIVPWWILNSDYTMQSFERNFWNSDGNDEDMDDECLLINTSIPGYHISLAYLPALNYSCDMDIRPISIYFMDHNSQNWTRYFIRILTK